MKKLLLILTLTLGITCSAMPKPLPVDQRKLVIDTALSQVGVREATGHNDGQQVEKYLRVVGFGKGYAWCAAFLAWDFYVNGIPALKTAWGPSWFPKGKTTIHPTTALPGDVFGLWIGERIAHVGFIYEWPAGSKWVKTIEGNTNQAGSREGDGVYVKRRLAKQIYATSVWIKG
jgi:hypothetical protein